MPTSKKKGNEVLFSISMAAILTNGHIEARWNGMVAFDQLVSMLQGLGDAMVQVQITGSKANDEPPFPVMKRWYAFTLGHRTVEMKTKSDRRMVWKCTDTANGILRHVIAPLTIGIQPGGEYRTL